MESDQTSSRRQSGRRVPPRGALDQGKPPDSIVQPAQTAAAKAILLAFLQDNTGALLGVIRSYTLRLGLAKGAEAQSLALEILQEVAVEALEHADRFDANRQPMAWLLGIALNVIRRRKVTLAQRQWREVPLTGLPSLSDDSGPGEPTDGQPRSLHLATPGPAQAVEAEDEARALLALVADDDRLILRLALLDDLEGQALARALGVSVGAARMRLHRALGRLRAAWVARQAHAARGAHTDDARRRSSLNFPAAPTPEKGAPHAQ